MQIAEQSKKLEQHEQSVTITMGQGIAPRERNKSPRGTL